MSLRIESGSSDSGETPPKPPAPRRNAKSPRASANSGGSESFRRLKPDEMVRTGDFVADQNGGFEAWDGPGGFLADAFLKPIYRRNGTPKAEVDPSE
jgi:hypothetical protein